MKKDLIYGAITAVIVLILLVGAVMNAPEQAEDPPSTTGSGQTSAPSTALTTVPTGSTGEATAPTQTEPTQMETQPAEPETKPTEPPTQPTEPVTEPMTQTTEPKATEEQASGIRFITWPETIAGGQTGTVTVQGQPNTTYTIQVYYKSGPSGAKGLEDQVSDADGFVTWTWKVSKNTKPGDFRIVVTGGGETAEVPFTVLD